MTDAVPQGSSSDEIILSQPCPLQEDPLVLNPLTQDQLDSNKRNLIDIDVLTWVTTGQTEGKVITPNLIRQKAYEIGRQYDPYFKASINWYNKWKKKYNYEESAEADALKHKKRSYTAAFKLYAVQRANELLSVSQASLELNVSRRCLQRWKDEIDVISKVAEKASNAVYRRPGQGRKVTDSSLDARLLEWLEESWRNDDHVSAGCIRQKARELTTSQDFKASLGWFVKWQKRHNIDLKERTMDASLKDAKAGNPTSLRLRLLPEGQEVVYSEHSNLSRKRKRDFEGVAIQGDEEFDRLLLTWLVERWEAGLTVNEKMLRDRALELNAHQGFRPSKNWLSDWKTRYNVSLEEQTYGVGGESEGEIVEESQVFDEVALQEDPLTPTKEEAATALASLASEGPGCVTTGGLEIAQALQKLATAFGLTHEVSKNSLADQLQLGVSHIAPPPNSSSLSSVLSPSVSSTTYLLENGEVQVGAEEVISEEIVTDEPVLVLDTTGEPVGGVASTPSTDYQTLVTTPTSDYHAIVASPTSDYQTIVTAPASEFQTIVTTPTSDYHTILTTPTSEYQTVVTTPTTEYHIKSALSPLPTKIPTLEANSKDNLVQLVHLSSSTAQQVITDSNTIDSNICTVTTVDNTVEQLILETSQWVAERSP